MPRKLSAEQIRDLIQQYNISFVGPVPPSSWPTQHIDVFQQIRNISQERYEKYGPKEQKGILEVEETKKRVRRLNNIAYDCRTQRLNEAGWRLNTEPEVFFRFGTEVVWYEMRVLLLRATLAHQS